MKYKLLGDKNGRFTIGSLKVVIYFYIASISLLSYIGGSLMTFDLIHYKVNNSYYFFIIFFVSLVFTWNIWLTLSRKFCKKLDDEELTDLQEKLTNIDINNKEDLKNLLITFDLLKTKED